MSRAVSEARRSRLVAAAGGSFPALSLCYAALFAGFGTEAPFFPAFLREKGLQPNEIGTLLSAAMLVRLSVGPFLGATADRTGARRLLALSACGAGVIGFGYLAGARFSVLLVVALAHSGSLAALSPLLDAISLGISRREQSFAYGWVRGVGSAAFVIATLVSGAVVGAFGLGSVIVVSSILFALVAAPLPLIAADQDGRELAPANPFVGFRDVFAIPIFRRTLLVAGLIIGSQAMSDTFAVIHWQSAGISSKTAGVLWAEAVLSEVLVFFVIGPKLLRRFGPSRCAAGSAVAGIVQWGALATTASPAILCMSQPLHGFTFALAHLACMQVIGETVPPHHLATGQTLYGTLSLGIASAVLTFLAGEIWITVGAHGFWIMSALCLCAAPLAWTMPPLSAPRAIG